MGDRALDNYNDQEGDGRGAALRGGIVTPEELDVALLWVKPPQSIGKREWEREWERAPLLAG